MAAKGGAVAKGPKTKASIRTVAVDGGTIAVLEALRSSQAQLAKICEMVLSDDGFVFSAEPGGKIPPHPEAMTHTFIKVRKQAAVAADVHLHSLRHFQATILDPVIPERQKLARLGWATVRMARYYTDGLADEDRRAAEHVGRVLNNEREVESNGTPQAGHRPTSDISTGAS